MYSAFSLFFFVDIWHEIEINDDNYVKKKIIYALQNRKKNIKCGQKAPTNATTAQQS